MILLEAIGHVEDASTEAERQERFMKVLAYHGGPVILDVVLQNLGPQTEPPPGSDLEHEQALFSRSIKLLELLMSGPMPPGLAFEISEISRALDESPPVNLETVFGRRASQTVHELFGCERIFVVPEVPASELPPALREVGKAG